MLPLPMMHWTAMYLPHIIGHGIWVPTPALLTSGGTDITGDLFNLVAGSLESAYSLNWDAREIWGKGGGETLALLL